MSSSVRSSQNVAILGAGFSGLTLARELNKRGLKVEVFEKQNRLGGLIQTHQDPILCESAAHAILASQDVENLFSELNLPMLQAKPESKAKWIFRGKPRRWPLKTNETIRALIKLIQTRMKDQLKAKKGETIQAWCGRAALPELCTYLLGPALQGIYGAQPDALSASLIIGGMAQEETRIRKGRIKGSIVPPGGMSELIQSLGKDLEKRGVQIHLKSQVTLADLQSRYSAVVIASSLPAAADILHPSFPVFAKKLKSLPMLSVSSATLGFPKHTSERLHGFGCLFPRTEGFESLGVLFNTDIFEKRGEGESETWILPDDYSKDAEAAVLEKILQDRKRMGLPGSNPTSFQIFRWPQGLPLYGIQLEEFLSGDHFEGPAFRSGARLSDSAMPLYFSGNYLGAIGLTKILSYNGRLADRMKKELQKEAALS